jgi:hypothetical protein
LSSSFQVSDLWFFLNKVYTSHNEALRVRSPHPIGHDQVDANNDVFRTGSTGYIGGDALYAIVKAHPEYEITALVRNPDKGAQVAVDYPKVKLVYGDLDSSDLLEEESKKADIVCRA